MPIIEQRGNALGVSEGIIAHGCNALGFMGAGFALKIRQRFPAAFAAYKSQQRSDGLLLGSVSFAQVGERLWVANVITQARIYGAAGEPLADLDAIEKGMSIVAAKALELGLAVEMPLIGCGLAHGQWNDIRPRIEAGLGQVQARVWIFEPAPRSVKGWRAPR